MALEVHLTPLQPMPVRRLIVLKSKVDYQKSELPKFIEKMRCLVDEQRKELERAVCRRGKYRFCSQYQYLEVEEGKWFNMTPERRHKHLLEVHQTVLAVSGDELSAVSKQHSTSFSQHVQSTSCSFNPSLQMVESE